MGSGVWDVGAGGFHPNFTTSIAFGSGGGFLSWNMLIPSQVLGILLDQVPRVELRGRIPWSEVWQGLVQSLFSPGLNIHRTHQVWRAHSAPRAAGEAGMGQHQKELKRRIFLGGDEDSRHISLMRTPNGCGNGGNVLGLI